MSYKHLSIMEREMIAIYRAMNWSMSKIADKLGRDKSTISRELKRNPDEYLPSKAQAAYHKRRKKCRPHKLLEKPDLFALVKKLFLELHWSPEQIANRLKLETYPIQISYKTIYRAIYSAMFDTPEQKRSATRASRVGKKVTSLIAGKSQSVTSYLNVPSKQTNEVGLAIGNSTQ